MPEQDLHEKMHNLASKYLSGNASLEEIRELESWVLADPENKALFMAFKKAWMLTGLEKDQMKVDVQTLWDQTAKQLFEKKKTEPKIVPIRRTWMRYAATLALLVVATFLLYQFFGKDSAFYVQTADATEIFQLPDGSEVTLNKASSLRYKLDKSTSRRLIELTGDAFFDVHRDEEIPFVIQTHNLEIEVLGTSFYVDSRTDQQEIQVIVETGSVAVRTIDDEAILEAKEKAVFEKQSGSLTKVENEDQNYLSVKTNILNFNDSSLEEVAFALNRQYNVDISIAISDQSNCKLTSIFKDKSLEAVLTVIERTLGIEALEENGLVILSGAQCN